VLKLVAVLGVTAWLRQRQHHCDWHNKLVTAIYLVGKSASNSEASALCSYWIAVHFRRQHENGEDQGDSEEEDSEEEDDDADPANSRDAPDPRDCIIS